MLLSEYALPMVIRAACGSGAQWGDICTQTAARISLQDKQRRVHPRQRIQVETTGRRTCSLPVQGALWTLIRSCMVTPVSLMAPDFALLDNRTISAPTSMLRSAVATRQPCSQVENKQDVGTTCRSNYWFCYHYLEKSSCTFARDSRCGRQPVSCGYAVPWRKYLVILNCSDNRLQ